MIEIEFKNDKDSNWVTIHPKDEKYSAIWKISHWQWTSDSVAYDIQDVKQAKAGTYMGEDGEDWFSIGYEGSPGSISVLNNEAAFVCDAWDGTKMPYLKLTFDELLDVLQQFYDYMKKIGR